MSYTSKQVVEQVKNLNSTRTLRRWTELAASLCQATFQYEYMNVGYKHTRLKYLAYSEEDIEKFQVVANTKKELGLQNAIVQAFQQEKQLTLVSLDQRLGALIENLNKILKNQSEKITELEKQRVFMAQDNHRLNKRIERLEQALGSKATLKGYWRQRASP